MKTAQNMTITKIKNQVAQYRPYIILNDTSINKNSCFWKIDDRPVPGKKTRIKLNMRWNISKINYERPMKISKIKIKNYF